MEIKVILPLDNDGFLRRQCPNCNSQFKWHNGPANEEAESEPSPASYYCPLCGRPAEPDRWFTDVQINYINGMSGPAITRQLDDLLDDTFKGLSSKHMTWTKTGHLDAPCEPAPLIEQDDMVIVVAPCHNYEPVKVPEDDPGPFHCLVCGGTFAI